MRGFHGGVFHKWRADDEMDKSYSTKVGTAKTGGSFLTGRKVSLFIEGFSSVYCGIP